MDINDLKTAIKAAQVGGRRLNDLKVGDVITFDKFEEVVPEGQTEKVINIIFKKGEAEIRVSVNALAGMRIANNADKLTEVNWSHDVRVSDDVNTIAEMLQSDSDFAGKFNTNMKFKVAKQLKVANNMAKPVDNMDFVPTLQNQFYEGFADYLKTIGGIRSDANMQPQARNDAYNNASNELRSSNVKKDAFLSDDKKMLKVPVFTVAS